MKKIIRISGIIVLVLILFVIASPFLFKGKIEKMVKEEINNTLNAKVNFGTFDISIFKSFPNLQFTLNDLQIIGIESFAMDTLIRLKSFGIDMNLMSVITGSEIKISGILLDQPDILVKVLESGRANYDIMKETGGEQPVDKAPAEPSNFKIGLKKFIIRNGDIVYDDREMKFFTEIKNMNYTLSGDMTENFTSLATEGKMDAFTMIYEGVKYINKAKVDLKAGIDADMEKYVFTFRDNVLRLNELELGLNGKFGMPDEGYDLDLSFEAKKTDFKNILSMIPVVYMTDFEKVQTSGKLSLKGYAKGMYTDSVLPAFGIKLLVENGRFKYPDLPKSAENIHIDLNIKNGGGGEDNTIIDLNRFHVEMAGNPLDMRMHTETPVSDPKIDGEIKGKIDMVSIRDVVPMDDMTVEGQIEANVQMKGRMSSIENGKYEEFLATGKVDITNFTYNSNDFPQGVTIRQSSMIFTPRFLELISFDSKIGRSDLRMNGKIENFLAYAFRDSLLKGQFNFQSSFFDLNEFMTEGDTTQVAADTAASELSVVEVPKNIDFILTSTFGKILYDKMELTNVAGKIGIKEGIVNMENFSMNLLDGSMKLNGSYSTKDITKPSIDFGMNITGFDIPKTFNTFNTVQKLAPIAKYCTGQFSTQLTLNSILDKHMEPLMNTLNGEGRLQTKGIVITQSDVMTKIADKLKVTKLNKPMKIQDVNIHFIIENGKITIDPVETTYEKMLAVFGGWQGVDQTLGYSLNLKVPRSEFGAQANQAVNDLVSQAQSKGLNVDVDEFVDVLVGIGGTILDPKITVNLKNPAKNAADDLKKQVKDELNKQKEALEQKAREEAEKLKKQAEEEALKLKQEAEKKAKEEADKLKKKAQEEADKKKKEAENEAKKQLKKIIKR